MNDAEQRGVRVVHELINRANSSTISADEAMQYADAAKQIAHALNSVQDLEFARKHMNTVDDANVVKEASKLS